MGKGTDKLYITASEWSSSDAFSASAGANVARNGYTSLTSTNTSSNPNLSKPRLPYNFCALTLQPVPDGNTAVCTPTGTVFDHAAILNWLAKNSKNKNANGSGSSVSSSNPVDPTGPPLRAADLIRLNFTRNDDNEIVDPVTYRPFTQGTRVVALRPTGNVFARETVERLNVKAKHWQDLISDEPFTRADIIGLQEEQQQQQQNKKGAGGDAGKIEKAKEAVARARAERENKNPNGNVTSKPTTSSSTALANGKFSSNSNTSNKPKPLPYNAAIHTTGKAAASFTSTGLTPHTSNERAILTDEEYMLRPRRVKAKGYARIATNIGDLSVELSPEYAPKAVWNFVQLAKKGYYKDVVFHRNMRGFMIQTGDPTGTGRGGTSIWNKPFADEFDGPLTHDSRGILSMANKGKNTNTSQFFITYRPAKHLDNKHVVFGKVVDGGDQGGRSGKESNDSNSSTPGGGGGASFATLARLEQSSTDEKDRPTEKLFIRDIVVYVDPFEEFLKSQGQGQGHGQGQKQGKQGTMNGTAEARNNGFAGVGVGVGAGAGVKRSTDRYNDDDEDIDNDNDDSTTTWTGRKLNTKTNNNNSNDGDGGAGVGKYLKAAMANTMSTGIGDVKRDHHEEENGTGVYRDEMMTMMMPPPPKKIKSAAGRGGGVEGVGSFGNFDNW